MDVKPNYYSIIPANVRYDKDLTANAKLLYGEITSLCNDKGYCWATNQYFCNLYEVSDRTIRNLLQQLSEKNYIKISILKNSKRLIYIDFTTPENNFRGGGKIFSSPQEKNFLHNNKSNNKIEYKNNEEELVKEIDEILDYAWYEE